MVTRSRSAWLSLVTTLPVVSPPSGLQAAAVTTNYLVMPAQAGIQVTICAP